MNLLVDIGNSRIKWACAVAGTLCHRGGEFYQDETLVRLLDEHWRDLPAISSVHYCSVGASAAADDLESWARQAWGIEPSRVRPAQSAYGVRCAYRNPESLGADRWAALVGTWHKYHRAGCIVDCGTAITLDAISHAGEHLGGVILPGVELMRHALSTRTDGIPPEVTDGDGVLATSTAAGMAAGTLYAAAAGVDRIVAEMRSSLPVDSVTLLTGGGAGRLVPLMSTEFIPEPDLVLYGLGVMGGALT